MRLNSILLMGLMLVAVSMKAQLTEKPIENYLTDIYTNQPNTYYKDTDNKLKNLVGTWVYENGTDYFMITFYKNKVQMNEKYNVYLDILTSNFLYKKNEVVIYDNYGTNNYSKYQALPNTKPSEIESNFIRNRTVFFSYSEPSANDCHRSKIGDLGIIYNDKPQPKIHWKRISGNGYFHEMPCDNGIAPDDSDFVIPEEMVLIKQ
ncbi:DUF6705 family protein [Sphingobacterium spiritivorum]|uniref:DUF6705 family protein n=1 Tax=Sphingobacterium spiritivorum TaxID=258 RepID=UPI003DA69E19